MAAGRLILAVGPGWTLWLAAWVGLTPTLNQSGESRLATPTPSPAPRRRRPIRETQAAQ